MYILRNEEANFCGSVLTDLKNRGVEDILITCIDGLNGFPDVIPKRLSQYNSCIALRRTSET